MTVVAPARPYGAATYSAPTGSERTYVLVHGAFHGGWCWRDVASRLRALGHQVYAPTLTGLGERSHLLPIGPSLEIWREDVAQLFRYEDLSDVVLVGHSFGGSTISGVADLIPERLRHLVYLDALVLQDGESPALRSPRRVAAYRELAMATSDGLTIPVGQAEHYGVTDPAMAAWLLTKLTPHPLNTYYDALALKNPLGNGVPATYIACTNPLFNSTKDSRERAKSLPGWTYLELPTAHDAMLLMPDELTEMLLAI